MRFALLAVVTFLAACSAGSSVIPNDGGASREPSWVSPRAAAATRLLYISDLGKWQVYMYTFPSLKIVGKLTGFTNPQGGCSDAAGNVWIANAGTDQLFEYAHGGTAIKATLSDPVGTPVGCAVDAATGDLAVTNLYGYSGVAQLLVYVKAHGTPRIYSNDGVYSYYFAAYDRGGNLYASAASSSAAFLLAKLAKGATTISLVSIKGGTIYFPGTVAWQSSTLVLGDQHCKNERTSCLYDLKVAGKTATIERSIPLTGSCDVVEAWVGATQIAAGDNGEYCGKGRSEVDIWRYPQGGKPTAAAVSPRLPVGAVLSTAGGD